MSDTPKNITTIVLLQLKERLFAKLGIINSDVLENQFRVAIEASEAGNTFAAILNHNRLNVLLNELTALQSADESTYQKLKKAIVDSKDHEGNFHGARFELHIAEQLHQKGVIFQKQESPDFRVDPIGIECTSCRKAGGEADARRKLEQAIKKKSKKTYADRSCVLKIDITNLFFFAPTSDWQMLLDELTELAIAKLDEFQFGAYGLFLYVQSQNQLHKYSYLNNVVISDDATLDVREFVKNHFPNIGVTTHGPAIPREG